MANYYGDTRTNYFRVTDKDGYDKIIKSIVCNEDSIHFWTREIDGESYYAFGAHDDISGICECEHCEEVAQGKVEFDVDECLSELNYDKMCDLLQTVVHPEDAIIITSVGKEKLNYVCGYSTIITKNGIVHKDLWREAMEEAKNLLDNKDYNTTYSY